VEHGIDLNMDVTIRKQPRSQIFLTKTRQRVGLIINPNHETRKTRTTTQHMYNKNPTKIYYKEGME
jgi:hypothetical protein